MILPLLAPAQETLGNIWKHLWLSQLGRQVLLATGGWGARDDAQHPTVPRMAPPQEGLPGPETSIVLGWVRSFTLKALKETKTDVIKLMGVFTLKNTVTLSVRC